MVLRGLSAFCTVCGASRTPWASRALNLAGKPARYGGQAARIVGFAVLAVGLFLALAAGLILQALIPTMWLGYAVATVIALPALFFGVGGILGGTYLRRRGRQELAEAQLDTVRNLAVHRRNVLTAADVASALDVSASEADAILTELARRPEENVGIDVDDAGRILYLFHSSEAMRWRIKAEAAGLSEEDRRALEAEAEAELAEAEAALDARRTL
ncbi:MAG: hypothetical protein AAGA56_01790 [Myxococcota bacterium]